MERKTKVIIVHGTQGSPSGNWFPWLVRELHKLDVEAVTPTFPTPDKQSFTSWKEIFVQELDRPTEHIILVGHSIGAPFILRMAEEAETPYRAIFPVCPFARQLGIKGFDSLNATFVEHTFDWARIKKGAIYKCCFVGTNDPYVPTKYSTGIATATDSELVLIENGGHLNAEFNYTEFPALLQKLQPLLQ